MLTAEDLKQFGKVEKCEEVDNTFHVIITDGFDDNNKKTLECLYLIDNAIGHKYPVLGKCISRKDYLEYIAKPSA